MSALVVSLLALLLGYIFVSKGPIVFAAAITTVVSALLVRTAASTDARLAGLSEINADRFHDGNGWTRDAGEQKLLRDALRTALRRTELYNQYPNSATSGIRLAERLGWA